MRQLNERYSGVLLASVIGLIAHFASAYTSSSFNGILLALLLGMLVGNVVAVPARFQSGIGFTSSKLLEISVLFLAFSINYAHIADLGVVSFSIVAVVVAAMVFVTFFLSERVKCPASIGWLVGFGTAICGSSAIAALAPRVATNKEDVGIAMAVVNLFGSLSMIVMPLVLVGLDLDTSRLGLLIGGTLHSVGNVVGAGYAMDNAVGEAAITIKLARVALLSPALILFNYLVNRKQVKSWKEHFDLPWYLWGFVGITVLTSLVSFPAGVLGALDTAGKLILTIAMAAIGLKVSFKALYRSGRKGLGFGLMIFLIQLLLVAGLMGLSGM